VRRNQAGFPQEIFARPSDVIRHGDCTWSMRRQALQGNNHAGEAIFVSRTTHSVQRIASFRSSESHGLDENSLFTKFLICGMMLSPSLSPAYI
jgi:hypothetical protein